MHFKAIPRWSFIAVLVLFTTVTSAYNVCYTIGTIDYYCESLYTCCDSNTKCCYGSSSSSSSSSSRSSFSSYTSNSSSSSSLSIEVIVGIAIGSIVFVIIVGTIIRVCVIKCGHSGRVIQPAVQTTAQAYPQQINYTHTSSQYQSNSATNAGQNGPYANMTAYYQPDGQALPSNPLTYSDTANQNQRSGDQVAGAIP